jgi:CheY-like chemotaxis protein
MGSPSPISDHQELVRHSCGELNPLDACFCGGCGTELGHGRACQECGHLGTAGARFCQQCGMRLAGDDGADPALAARLAAVEAELASTRENIAALLQLKEQLDAALDRMRQRQGGPARGPARPATPKPAAPTPAATAEAAETAAVETPAVAATAPPPAEQPEAPPGPAENAPSHIVVVHFEDRDGTREMVRAAVAPYTTASYHAAGEIDSGLPEGRRLAIVNLAGGGDPLAGAAHPALDGGGRSVFAYATDGARGFVLGMTDLFPPPLEPEAWAARLLAVLPASPRLLVVSGAVLGTPELRAQLVRQGCTTSIAFDDRQALGLIPSVRPNMVLIDLNLPRGEALRLAARLRADAANGGTRIGLFWQETIEPALLRQQASRAILDYAFDAETFARVLAQQFNPGGAAYIAPR